MFVPSNNFAKVAIAAEHQLRIELSDELFFPIAVDIDIPSQPMRGGSVGNRSGQARRLSGDDMITNTGADVEDGDGIGGNTGAYSADYSFIEGDPVSVVRAKTSDGIVFYLNRYDHSGMVTIEDQRLPDPGGAYPDYRNVPRYVIKSDGVIYDALQMRGGDTDNNGNGPYQHWEFAASSVDNTGTNPNGYTGGTNSYDPTALGNGDIDGQYASDIDAEYTNRFSGAALTTARNNPFLPQYLTPSHYVRPVGFISFRPKQGAASGAIQEQLTRAQSTIDTLSRILRSLHDEAKGPFANIVVR